MRPPQSRALSLFAFLPLAVGLVLAIALLWLAGANAREKRFEEFALAEGTKSLFASLDGHKIHCAGLWDLQECISGWKSRGSRPVVLWLGNSQVHAVNQWQPEQENAPPILHRALATREMDLLTFSQPNASLQEHFVLFEHVSRRLPVKVLILAVVFDDLRETGLRPDLVGALAEPEVVATLRQSPIGAQLVANYDDQHTESADLAGLRETVQEGTERTLNALLEKHFSLWELRPEIRGLVFTSLYRLRNSVLGIDPQTKRRMITGRYARNFEALEATLDSAASRGIAALVYVAPLRDDVEMPYVQTEYEAFKKDLRRVVTTNGAIFANLESLIPAEFWGTKDATAIGGTQELDFMHFRAEGHGILAAKLESQLARSIPEDSK